MGEMPGATHVHPDSSAWEPARHLTGTTGMVEMDVRNDERREIIDAECLQNIRQMPEGRRRSDFYQYSFRGVE
jgi:hypothetical protein